MRDVLFVTQVRRCSVGVGVGLPLQLAIVATLLSEICFDEAGESWDGMHHYR